MQSAAQLIPLQTLAPREKVAPKSPLWVGIHFPLLALEAMSIGAEDYAVVVESSKHGAIVRQASVKARAKGVVPGLSVNAAMAICTGLRIYPRDVEAERHQLQKFHHWARQFTPTVCVEFPHTLVFEVAASLKLFGGLDALCEQLRFDLERLGYRYALAVTPTPAASSILATAMQEVVITNKAGLRTCLGKLPIQSLGLMADINRKLHASGVDLLCELWRLPRHDLARRFGSEVIRKIDHLLGTQPDPRSANLIPLEFNRRCELEQETREAELILFVVQSLLVQLKNFLQRVDAVAKEIQVSLYHSEQSAAHFKVGARLPTSDLTQWKKLVYEHIQRCQLDAPVTAVHISSRHFLPNVTITEDLFNAGDPAQAWARSLDELEARLGTKYLWTPTLVADHRPEYAWCRSNPQNSVSSATAIRRPLWLFQEPQKLSYKKGHIWYAGPLHIIDGPERIESGWWDNHGYSRDYYTATSPQDGRLWIFRDMKQKNHWYLHGLFG